MRRLIGKLFLFCLLSGSFLHAQDIYLAKVWKGGQYGYIDIDGREVIPEIYDDMKRFSEGLLAVNIGATRSFPKSGGLWGFCDPYGRVVIKMQFQDVHLFKEGLAGVRLGDRWGYINKSGEMVIPPVFAELTDFSNQLAAVKNTNGKWGYINPGGQIVIEPKYDYAFPFNELGTARVFEGKVIQNRDKLSLQGQMGLIDRQGAFLLTPQFDDIGAFQEGMAQVSRHDSIGFINLNMELVVPPTYLSVSDFSEGMAKVSREERIMKKFETKAEQQLYDSLVNLMTERTIAAGKNRQKLEQIFNSPLAQKLSMMQIGRWETRYWYGFINKAGELVVPFMYHWADSFEGGLACVRIGPQTRSAFMGGAPPQDTHETASDDELIPKGIAIKAREGYGFINSRGDAIIPPIYTAARRCPESIYILNESYVAIAVDRNHETIISGRHKYLEYCGDGLFIFGDIDRQGLIYRNRPDQDILLDPAFEEIVYLQHRRFKVKASDGRSGIINAHGNWVVEPVYDHILSFERVNE